MEKEEKAGKEELDVTMLNETDIKTTLVNVLYSEEEYIFVLSLFSDPIA